MDREQFADRVVSLRESRARLPELVRNRHASRRRRPLVGHTGRVVLIEADQAAIGDLHAGADSTGLGDRAELLRRLFTALAHPRVDGVIGTADILDDLLLLEALESKLAVGSLSRGGLLDSQLTLADHYIGHDPETIIGSHLDGGKVELRLDPDAPATAGTLEMCSRAVTALSGGSTMALIEPSWCHPGTAEVDLSPAALTRVVSIASAMGGRSAFTWLAVPLIDDLAPVLAATTLPTLVRCEGVLSGVAAQVGDRLSIPGARGVVLSSSDLPADDDEVSAAVDELAELIETSLASSAG